MLQKGTVLHYRLTPSVHKRFRWIRGNDFDHGMVDLKYQNPIQFISLREGFLSMYLSYRLVAFDTLHIPPCLHVAFSTIRHELSWCNEVVTGSLVLKNSVRKGSIGLFLFFFGFVGGLKRDQWTEPSFLLEKISFVLDRG